MNQSNQEKKIFPEKKYKFLSLFVVFLLLIFSFFLGIEKGKEVQKKETIESVSLVDSFVLNKLDEKNTIDFSLFWKVWNILKEKHIDRESFEANSLMYGAIKGMLRATEDPYSNFFTPKETASFTEELHGSFEGIGSELGIKDNLLTIIAPLPNTPSEKAGLKAGDKIIKIDGKTANDLSIEKAVEMIRGEKGTQVVLTIFREGEEQTREITLVRDIIKLESVTFEFKEDNMAYVKINTFSEDTTQEFASFAKEAVKNKSTGIILDLRNNPGGLVDKCIEIASFLIEKNKVVVIEENNQGEQKELKTLGGDKLSHLPIVVLINEGSASASEILAGALKDNRNITLIGKKSFGKGSVQEYMSLPHETSTKITVAKWLTPKKKHIMNEGITPDIEISVSKEDFEKKRDPQLEKALEIIKEKIKK